MCGVVSIIYGKENNKLGEEACQLLKRLEYRGYDSTGAAFINEEKNISLRKKVGSPSKVVEELQIAQFKGNRFIGQVRWATFGAVTDKNSQPHIVSCFKKLVGAHNGNIANTDSLKEFLTIGGHNVISDNDGEIIVHMIEHFYSLLLQKDFSSTDQLFQSFQHKDQTFQSSNEKKNSDAKNLNLKISKNIHLPEIVDDKKILTCIEAIRRADTKANGSYAACITDPDIEGIFAIKSGSSLYAGIGSDENGNFIVVSSDLTSVLSKTRFLIPLKEGEGLYFTSNDYVVFPLSGNFYFEKPEAKRSRLNIKDTSLSNRFHFYMEQEIYTSSSNIDDIFTYYFIDDEKKEKYKVLEENEESSMQIYNSFINISSKKTDDEIEKYFLELIENSNFKLLKDKIYTNHKNHGQNHSNNFKGFISDEKQLLLDIFKLVPEFEQELLFIDDIIIWKKQRKILNYLNNLIEDIKKCFSCQGRVFAIASGTSYHAALTASTFFSNLASCSLFATAPGTFRSQFLNSLTENDILIVISQSGETKDLIDIIQDSKSKVSNLKVVGIVNNENSRIPQELSDYFLPILCGPEIAVAATKSFINQLVILYIIAFYLQNQPYDILQTQLKINLLKIKNLINQALDKCDKDLTEVALKLFLKPSIHILGTSLVGLAKEGALKIREVVLNHTEGYDAAEFKHGPNTILGKNTIFSISDLEKLFNNFVEFLRIQVEQTKTNGDKMSFDDIIYFLKDLDSVGLKKDTEFIENFKFDESDLTKKTLFDFMNKISLESYFTNYPLIFICPPDQRDIRITISQIHTHKIRGADIILIAEYNQELYKSISGIPANSNNYFYKYIEIPLTEDKNLFVFPAAVVLQTLAFKMSMMKMKYLNSLHIDNHGVHPDAPKNVSKSITVD